MFKIYVSSFRSQPTSILSCKRPYFRFVMSGCVGWEGQLAGQRVVAKNSCVDSKQGGYWAGEGGGGWGGHSQGHHQGGHGVTSYTGYPSHGGYSPAVQGWGQQGPTGQEWLSRSQGTGHHPPYQAGQQGYVRNNKKVDWDKQVDQVFMEELGKLVQS